MAGRESSQNKKNETKSLVFVPELAGIVLGKSCQLGQIERIIR
jgi:hypothetical protein